MKIFNVFASFVLAFAIAAAPVTVPNIQDAKDKAIAKAEASTFALYASSASRGVSDRFICTATAIAQVQGGYELLSAGHCTQANDRLPSDLTFKVSEQLGGNLMPVTLVKAVMEDEPQDFSIFYLPTKNRYSVEELGNQGDAHIGDPTININFSAGITKEYSPGIVVSEIVTIDDPMLNGLFGVQQFGTGGASGSSVIDTKTGKIIGIVVVGADGMTMPMFCVPITVVEAGIAGIAVPPPPGSAPDVKIPPARPTMPDDDEDGLPFYVQRGGNHSSSPGHGNGVHSAPPQSGGERGGSNGDNRGSRNRGQHGSDNRGGVRNHQGSQYHGRVDRRGIRVIGGHQCFGWYGAYFWAPVYPAWFWSQDIYLVEVAPGIWMVYSYDDPALQFPVGIQVDVE